MKTDTRHLNLISMMDYGKIILTNYLIVSLFSKMIAKNLEQTHRHTNGLSEYLIPIEFKFIRIIHRQPFFVSTSSIGGGAV